MINSPGLILGIRPSAKVLSDSLAFPSDRQLTVLLKISYSNCIAAHANALDALYPGNSFAKQSGNLNSVESSIRTAVYLSRNPLSTWPPLILSDRNFSNNFLINNTALPLNFLLNACLVTCLPVPSNISKACWLRLG